MNHIKIKIALGYYSRKYGNSNAGVSGHFMVNLMKDLSPVYFSQTNEFHSDSKLFVFHVKSLFAIVDRLKVWISFQTAFPLSR